MPRGGGRRAGGGGVGSRPFSSSPSPSPPRQTPLAPKQAPVSPRLAPSPRTQPPPRGGFGGGGGGSGLGSTIAGSFFGSALGSVLGNAIAASMFRGRDPDTGASTDPAVADDNPCKKELDYFIDCAKYAGDPAFCKSASDALKKCAERHKDYFESAAAKETSAS